ncbi:MAG TPA: hypothetical protein VFU23_10175 [Gemmatimonadales bacterium]|nr:hypothetical protein [Gemmatimonadales bacterium]
MRVRRILAAIVAVTACSRAKPAPTATGATAATAAVAPADTARPWRQPGDKIDSILPMPEYLRRFRAGLTEPHRVVGGADTRKALARTVLAGLAARDTAGLTALLVTPAEFGWLVFPDHLYARPPYELDPAVFWMQLQQESVKGLHRVLERYGGKPLTFQSLECRRDTTQITTGPVRLWSSCLVAFQVGDSVETHRLFGSIVKRDGRMKLLSFATDF